MFSFISWQQYLLAVGIAGFFYYLVVILRFYKTSRIALRKNARSGDFVDPVMGEARQDLRESYRSKPDIPVKLPDDQTPNLN